MNREYKYAVGSWVEHRGKTVAIEARSHNINGINIYKIAGTWVPELKIVPVLEPPCPV